MSISDLEWCFEPNTAVWQDTCDHIEGVGSRVIVLLLSFYEYFVQLAYSCTHLFSDTGHLLSTATPSLEPVRSTRGRCEVIRTHILHFILQPWHEKYDQLDVYSDLLLVPVGRDVCSRPDEREHCCWPLFYRFTGAFPSADRARAVRDTDRPASGTTWSSPSPSPLPSPCCSWPWILVVGVANAASRRGRRRSAFHSHLPNFCCYLAAGQPFMFTFLVFCLSGTL